MQEITTQQKRETLIYMPETSHGQQSIQPQVVEDLFKAIGAITPAWKLAMKTQEELNESKRQWMMALNESQITNMELINLGLIKMRAKGSAFMPSTGDFIQLCKTGMAESMGIKPFKETMRIIERSQSNHPAMWHLWVDITPFEYWLKLEQSHAERDGFDGTYLVKEMKERYQEGIDKVFNGFEFPCAPPLVKPEPKEPESEKTPEDIARGKETIRKLKELLP